GPFQDCTPVQPASHGHRGQPHKTAPAPSSCPTLRAGRRPLSKRYYSSVSGRSPGAPPSSPTARVHARRPSVFLLPAREEHQPLPSPTPRPASLAPSTTAGSARAVSSSQSRKRAILGVRRRAGG